MSDVCMCFSDFMQGCCPKNVGNFGRTSVSLPFICPNFVAIFQTWLFSSSARWEGWRGHLSQRVLVHAMCRRLPRLGFRYTNGLHYISLAVAARLKRCLEPCVCAILTTRNATQRSWEKRVCVASKNALIEPHSDPDHSGIATQSIMSALLCVLFCSEAHCP